jgi:hypothetical protein
MMIEMMNDNCCWYRRWLRWWMMIEKDMSVKTN